MSDIRQVLGYNPMQGNGINNQKIALIGLFLAAYETGASVVLPKLTLMDQTNNIYRPIPFGSIFEEARLRVFAKKWSISLTDAVPTEVLDGAHYFWKCMHYFESDTLPPPDLRTHTFILDFIASLRPHIRRSAALEILKDLVFKKHKIELAAQFRIERDWERHCRESLSIHLRGPEDYWQTYEQIVSKILRTMPEIRSIFVICDEPACPIPKETMRDICRRNFDVELFWKSDFQNTFDDFQFSSVEYSLIDFEIGLAAKLFVGITRSTFSSMISIEKHCAQRKPIASDFVYNKVGEAVARRTDNGFLSDPNTATQVRLAAL